MALPSIAIERRAVLALRLSAIYWQADRSQVLGVSVEINGDKIMLLWNEEVLATIREDES